MPYNRLELPVTRFFEGWMGILVCAIVVAAGSGRRMARAVNKVFLPLGGRPVLLHSVAALAACAEVDYLVVVVAAGEEAQAAALLETLRLDKPWRVVAGGSERQYSVAAALAAAPAEADIVAVHDGARPLVAPEDIAAAVAAAREHKAAVVAVPVKDTIKVVDAAGFVTGTPDRSGLWAMQTPQAFAAGLIRQAHAAAVRDGVVATDDAALVERLGIRVKIVPGSYRNLKITTPEDLTMAEALLRNGE